MGSIIAAIYESLPSGSMGDWTVPLIDILYGLIGGAL